MQICFYFLKDLCQLIAGRRTAPSGTDVRQLVVSLVFKQQEGNRRYGQQ